jgi:hypothetical protein
MDPEGPKTCRSGSPTLLLSARTGISLNIAAPFVNFAITKHYLVKGYGNRCAVKEW